MAVPVWFVTAIFPVLALFGTVALSSTGERMVTLAALRWNVTVVPAVKLVGALKLPVPVPSKIETLLEL